MKLAVRVLLLVAAVFAIATVVTTFAPKVEKRSPYASALSLSGIEEAQAAHPPIGPGCRRACSSSGCVITNFNSTCYVVNAETCVEEVCQ